MNAMLLEDAGRIEELSGRRGGYGSISLALANCLGNQIEYSLPPFLLLRQIRTCQIQPSPQI